jgi:hypothetical protein
VTAKPTGDADRNFGEAMDGDDPRVVRASYQRNDRQNPSFETILDLHTYRRISAARTDSVGHLPGPCRPLVNDNGRYHSLKSTARERSWGNRSLALTGAALLLGRRRCSTLSRS